MKQGENGDAPWMVLVGPAASGKTSLGAEVSARTGRLFVDLDDCAEEYYAEVGWSMDRLRARIAAVGRLAAEAEWEPARAHAVVRAVADYPGAVLALGAGHTSYRDDQCLILVRSVLSRCPHVVHLLPGRDHAKSLVILRQRCLEGKGRSWIEDGHDFLAHWLQDPGANLMATRTVYTEGETPAQTAERLLQAR